MNRSADDPGGASTEAPPGDRTGATPPRYLFPVDGDHSTAMLQVVCDLAADAGAEVVIAAPVTVPEQTPLDHPDPKREGDRQVAKIVFRAKQRCEGLRSITQVVRIGHDRAAILDDIVDTQSISLLVTEDQPSGGLRSLLGLDGVDDVALHDASDTIVAARIEHLETIDSVLVPVARGPHSGLAIETGLALARQNSASLELLHVHSPDDADGKKRGEAVLKTALERVDGYGRVERTLREASEVPEAIIDHAHPFDITVLGAPREGLLRRFVRGTIPDEVSARTDPFWSPIVPGSRSPGSTGGSKRARGHHPRDRGALADD